MILEFLQALAWIGLGIAGTVICGALFLLMMVGIGVLIDAIDYWIG